MIKAIPLDTSISDQWLSRCDPFSDDAIRHLQRLIAADHFMVVATLAREGQPFSLVFRAQKTILPAGERLRAEYEAKGKIGALARRSYDRPIDLEPLTDQPVVSSRGERPCSFREALRHAELLAQWVGYPVIYTFDGSNSGRA